jgi:hypothetical protein
MIGAKRHDDDPLTRARLGSAIPANSDKPSATAKARRAEGPNLEADEGSKFERRLTPMGARHLYPDPLNLRVAACGSRHLISRA